MNEIIVITVLADDRPGIVKTLSEAIVKHRASWVDSRMANLADKFAGLIRISVPTDQLHALKATLQVLHDDDNQLHILMDVANGDQQEITHSSLSLELIGADRPGIIDDITGALSKMAINIEALESEQREASMSSEILFWARLQLGLPEGVSNDDVQDALEALADQLMVDISLEN